MSNIRIDTWPDKTRSDQFLSGLDTREGEVVGTVKHNVMPRLWHNGLLCTWGSVTLERVR